MKTFFSQAGKSIKVNVFIQALKSDFSFRSLADKLLTRESFDQLPQSSIKHESNQL